MIDRDDIQVGDVVDIPKEIYGPGLAGTVVEEFKDGEHVLVELGGLRLRVRLRRSVLKVLERK